MRPIWSSMLSLLDRVYAGNTLGAWLAAGVVAVVIAGALALLRGRARRRLTSRAPRSPTLDNLIAVLLGQTRTPVILALAVQAGVSLLTLPPGVVRVV